MTVNDTDDPLVALADRLGLRWHRGSEDDVLARYVGAAREADADMVVRVTSDCPLIDAGETDAVIGALEARRDTCDYANNFTEPVLPLGLATEALLARRAGARRPDGDVGVSARARDAVHPQRAARAVRRCMVCAAASRLPTCAGRSTPPRISAMVRRLWAELSLSERDVPLADIVDYVRAHPDIARDQRAHRRRSAV